MDDVNEGDTRPVRVIVAETEGDILDDLLPQILALSDVVNDSCAVSVIIKEPEERCDTEAFWLWVCEPKGDSEDVCETDKVPHDDAETIFELVPHDEADCVEETVPRVLFDEVKLGDAVMVSLNSALIVGLEVIGDDNV